MTLYCLLKNLFIIFKIYKFTTKIISSNPFIFNNIWKVILVFLPFEITLLDDIESDDDDEKDISYEDETYGKLRKTIMDNLPYIIGFIIYAIILIYLVNVFFPDDDSFMSDTEEEPPTPPLTPKRKIIMSGNPQNLYRSFHYLDAETGEIVDLDLLEGDFEVIRK